MDRNLLLAFALSFVVIVLWTSAQPPPKKPQDAPPVTPGAEPAPPPEPPLAPLPSVPDAPRLADAPSAEFEGDQEILAFERPCYRAELTSLGAGLRHWELVRYDTGGDDPQPIVLTTASGRQDVLGVTPFDELGFGDLSRVVWQVERSDDDGAVFALTLNGVTLRKTWSLGGQGSGGCENGRHGEAGEGGYDLYLRLDLMNRSGAEVTTSFTVDWPAHVAPGNDFREQALVTLHAGDLEQQMLMGFGRSGFWNVFTGPPAKVVDYGEAENEWAGLHTTYFLAALLPDDPAKANVRFEVVEPGTSAVTRIFFDPVRIPSGLGLAREFRGYLGPKVPERLETLGGNTIRAIDLGWSWIRPLTRFFGWLLHEIYAFVPNYGVAIILLTILVRIVTTPLTMRQMRSMERLRTVQPRLKEIQAKYKDDRQKQSEEMMRLYRQEKVNPLGGCLPMLLQLPVFIGLFYALRGSIQLRQAAFVGWINDLSAPETLFEIPGLGIPVRVLPLVMGATMVLQQRITPMQMDPAQARMMMTVMPIMMTVIFYQFASGLVLYWMVSNVLAIAHQLWVGRRMRTEPKT